jgi:NADPH2:quinone reductase
MAEQMRAVVTEPTATPRLALREVPPPRPAPNQALIQVKAFSLNAGETRTALAAATRYTPGWDFAGVVEREAADGSSPKAGTRVFGVVPQGAWAEYVAARAGHLAEIVCLEEAGALLGRRVLITGAAGGVGRFACQLAALAGAVVFAVSRRPELPRQLQEDGVHPAGVFTTMAEAKAAGAYDVILDSVGGDTLGVALTALSFGGICVNCGNSALQPTTFDARDFYLKSNGRLHGVWLGRELAGNCTPMLTRLAALVKQGRLHTPIDAELPWVSVAEAADRLMHQGVHGKIVLGVA